MSTAKFAFEEADEIFWKFTKAGEFEYASPIPDFAGPAWSAL